MNAEVVVHEDDLTDKERAWLAEMERLNRIEARGSNASPLQPGGTAGHSESEE